MTDDEIYAKFDKINHWGDSDEIKLSSAQLKKIILTACKYARNSGYERGKFVAESLYRATNGGGSNNGADIYSKIFGNFEK